MHIEGFLVDISLAGSQVETAVKIVTLDDKENDCCYSGISR